MTITRRHLAPAVAVALATAVAPVAASAAGQEGSDPHARAHFIGKIQRVGTKATLRVRYRCASGQALWVSAKQTANGRRDRALTKEGSSKAAAAWWQSHRNPFMCNGAYHTATVSIDKVEPGSKGRLRKGRAWVQFCVTKGEQDLILSKSAWVGVRVRG